jgi:hypothetical protein
MQSNKKKKEKNTIRSGAKGFEPLYTNIKNWCLNHLAIPPKYTKA